MTVDIHYGVVYVVEALGRLNIILINEHRQCLSMQWYCHILQQKSQWTFVYLQVIVVKFNISTLHKLLDEIQRRSCIHGC